jgi:hypothetical protein
MFTKLIITLARVQPHRLHLLYQHLPIQIKILIILLILHNTPMKEPRHITIINYKTNQTPSPKKGLKRKKDQLLK